MPSQYPRRGLGRVSKSFRAAAGGWCGSIKQEVFDYATSHRFGDSRRFPDLR